MVPKFPKILVCDDDRLVLATSTAAIASAGFEVIEASTGDEAIALAREHRPVLAVLDIRMDGTSGLDVGAYLRDFVGTPFVFISAFSDPLTVRQARALGALDYLFKPISPDRLISVIARLIDTLNNAEDAGTADWIEFGRARTSSAMDRAPNSETLAKEHDLIDLATGMLMVRLETGRQAAFEYLLAMAAEEKRTLHATAMMLVDQLESVKS